MVPSARLYSVEQNSLLPARESLKEMAQALATLVNDTLAGGYDLNGNPGQPLLAFNPNSSNGLLQINDLKPGDWRFLTRPGKR